MIKLSKSAIPNVAVPIAANPDLGSLVSAGTVKLKRSPSLSFPETVLF